MVDYGWWFYFERADGKPLPAWQFAFWMIVSPIMNMLFVLAAFLMGIVYVAGSVIFWPFFYFKRTYKEYCEQFSKEQAETWKRISK